MCERERERENQIRVRVWKPSKVHQSLTDRHVLHGQTEGEREREMIGLGLGFEAFELKVG